MTAINFSQGREIGKLLGQQFQQVVGACQNQVDKLCDAAGRGARLESLKLAPKNVNINLGRIIKAPADAPSIQSRLDGAAVKARQLSNVIGHCVQEEGEPTSERLNGLKGDALKEVIGEHPREATSFKEHMRANVERLGYFLNRHVGKKSPEALAGTRPTVEIVKARAARNAEVDGKNSAKRNETAQKLAQYVGRVGLPGAFAGISRLVNSDDFKSQVAEFPKRVQAQASAESQSEKGVSPAEEAEQKTSEVGDAKTERALPTISESATEDQKIGVLVSQESDAESVSSASDISEASDVSEDSFAGELSLASADVARDVEVETVVSEDSASAPQSSERFDLNWDDLRSQGQVVWTELVNIDDMPKANVDGGVVGNVARGEGDAVVETSGAPAVRGAWKSAELIPAVQTNPGQSTGNSSAVESRTSEPRALAPGEKTRDWVTIMGRFASLATIVALAYSYFSSQGADASDIAEQVGNMTKLA